MSVNASHRLSISLFPYKIILLCSLVATGLGTTVAQHLPQKMDSLISAYARLNRFNGNIIVLQKGKTLFKKSYGFRDVERESHLNGKDVFQLASMTKSFTAVMIMKLIEEGKLSLDTRISTFFPGLHPEKEITVRQLLNHTSGIREVLKDSTLKANIMAGLKGSHEQMLTYFSAQPLDFEPGTQFSYSNSGYDLLGMIIEKLTGEDYGKAVDHTIFMPLGMHNSGLDYLSLKSNYKTVGYEYLSANRQVIAPIWDESWTYASGGLYSSIVDLLKWNAALRDHTIIRYESLQETYKPGKGDYGYGWFVDELFGKKIYFHPGNLPGATSYFGRISSDDICIIMLVNHTSTDLEEIASKIVAIIYEKPYALPQAQKAIVLAEAELEKYVGNYDISNKYTTTISLKDKQLYLHTENAEGIAIYPETKERFFIKDSHMRLIFKVQENGKPSLTIREGLSTKVGELKE